MEDILLRLENIQDHWIKQRLETSSASILITVLVLLHLGVFGSVIWPHPSPAEAGGIGSFAKLAGVGLVTKGFFVFLVAAFSHVYLKRNDGLDNNESGKILSNSLGFRKRSEETS
ncbi:hypothetical protein DO97_19375 [Neosynechococcus sphagnicola sy1]|uniref:Uncharacterized protein n=1 Tax=Neosynechococcus sphagnicola sy1 TaxID=1497020 RepID=A0A098TFZ2_9CYAN|nr:hypothetical protein DO97_19375 [Neosynechococcus sphagnicola sy1]